MTTFKGVSTLLNGEKWSALIELLTNELEDNVVRASQFASQVAEAISKADEATYATSEDEDEDHAATAI